MGIKAHYLNDPDGNKFYPYAHADATFDRNGEKVGTRLDNADAEIEELKKRTNTAVQSVKIGDVEYKNGTDVVLPEYPTTLPASDVYDWAKQPTKPSYTKDEITGLENVENKSSETIRSEITKNNVTTALGYTPYTPNEVDNKLSALETNIEWKESVDTYDDIATTYPNPVDGWTVNVKDTDYTYRYNGSSWIAISANAIPKATNDVDGLLSKEDHAKYDDANSKKHVHDNKSVIDGITDTLVNNWNAAKTHADSSHARIDATNVNASTTNGNILVNGAETVVYTHPSGTNPHGTTKSDVGLGNVPNVSTNDQTPTYSEASTLEKLTSGEKLSVAFGKISKAITDFIAHIGDTVKHISSSERTNWNTAYTHSQSNHAPVNAEENQNAFSSIVVGSTTISADSKSDSLEFSGNNVTITPDSTNDKVTIGITKDNVISALGYTPGSSVDNNTTYTLSKSGSTITLTGSDGSKTSVEDANTDTTYSAGTGLSLSGTTFNHSNSVTAGTAQGDASKTLAFGGTFTIPTVTYDAQGHITGKGTTTMTMPANPNTDTKVTQTATTSNASYPLLLAPNGQTATATTTSYFDSGVTLNPSTNTIAANISGNAATSTKLGSSTVGSSTKPIYLSSGTATVCGNSLDASVTGSATTVPKALTSNGTTATTDSGYTYGVAGVASGNRIYSKWYVNLDNGVKTLTDGMLIEIKIPVTGSSSGCAITIDNGTNFHPVIYGGSSIITTHFAANNKILLMYDSTGTGSVYGTIDGSTATSSASITGVWRVMNLYTDGNTYTSAYCSTSASTASKTATCSSYYLLPKSQIHVIIINTNTAANALTLNINSQGAKPIYINGTASSSSNYSLPRGSYLVYYDGTNYYFRTDGAITGDLVGNSDTATKLATSRTIALTGSVTGSGTFDGSGNLSIATTTNHTHSYLPLSGGTLTITKYYGLTLNRSDANGVGISYANSSATLGGAGFLNNGYFQISSENNTSGNIFKANTTSATFPGTVTATSFIGTLSGNASTATKATQDSAGQQINTTYIKGLSVSGTTITYTKGDGTTGTITTQDTNTWRGIQNNLTSTSTSDSLSANQGKVLKDLVDTKATGAGLTFTVVNGILNVTYD